MLTQNYSLGLLYEGNLIAANANLYWSNQTHLIQTKSLFFATFPKRQCHLALGRHRNTHLWQLYRGKIKSNFIFVE